MIAAFPPVGKNVTASLSLIDPLVASIDCPREVGRSMSVTLPGVLRLTPLVCTSAFSVVDLEPAVPIVSSGWMALTRPGLAIVAEAAILSPPSHT